MAAVRGSRNAARQKRTAIAFLRAAAAGRDLRAAAARTFAPRATHHNVYFAAGLDVLLDAMESAAKENPATRLEVKHAVAEGDLVAIHSRVVHRRGDPGFAVVHLFRFARGRVVELWDVGMPLPKRSPNRDGAF